MRIRSGEDKKKSWFRCQRFTHTGEGWWFQTREGVELGPFSSHEDAEVELCLYLRNLRIFPVIIEQNSSLKSNSKVG